MPKILSGKSCERQFRGHAVEVRPIVFEFAENRVPVYLATAAMFIAKFFDFNPNLIQFTSYQLAQNSRGSAS